jgi:hypothetical protein
MGWLVSQDQDFFLISKQIGENKYGISYEEDEDVVVEKWIDYKNGTVTPETGFYNDLFGTPSKSNSQFLFKKKKRDLEVLSKRIREIGDLYRRSNIKSTESL